MTLKEIRELKGVSQKELAEKLGIDKSIVSKYETGILKPSASRLEEIAYLLETPVGTIEIEVYNKKKDNVGIKTRVGNYYYLLRRMLTAGSNGRCELCNQDAPFKDKEGRPFLQLHIIDNKYSGGDQIKNMVVLCPNCNARLAVLGTPEDNEKLKQIAELHSY